MSQALLEGVGLETSNLAKSPQLEELFKQALEGTLPRGRALKSWEPERLTPTALQIIVLRATGMRQRRIAEFLNETQGTNLTDSSVSIICNHPDAQHILAKILSFAADEVSDIDTRIKAYAGEAVDVAARIMRTTPDQRLAAKTAFEFLDRAGYNTVHKVEAKVQTVAPAHALRDLSDALKLTGGEVDASQYISDPAEVLQGEGSGNSLAVPESADSGQLSNVPPVSASPNPRTLLGKDIEPEQEAILDQRVA